MRPPERAAFCLFARRVYFEIHFIKNGRRAHSKMSDIHSVMCSKLNCVYFSSLPLAASRGSAMFPCELRKFDAEYAEASRWSSVFARFDRMNLFCISLFGQMLPRKIWQKSRSLRWDTIPNWLAPCWRAECTRSTCIRRNNDDANESLFRVKRKKPELGRLFSFQLPPRGLRRIFELARNYRTHRMEQPNLVFSCK